DRTGLQSRTVLAGQDGAAEAQLAAHVRTRQAYRAEVTGARSPEVGSAVIAAERVAADRHPVGQERRAGRRRQGGARPAQAGADGGDRQADRPVAAPRPGSAVLAPDRIVDDRGPLERKLAGDAGLAQLDGARPGRAGRAELHPRRAAPGHGQVTLDAEPA